MLKIGFVKTKMTTVGKDLFIVLTVHKKPVHFVAVPEQQEAARDPIRSDADQVEITHRLREPDNDRQADKGDQERAQRGAKHIAADRPHRTELPHSRLTR